ncbi:DNA polymerase III subunit beta [candidate division KSB1 bacterium RBG_16_48_16]|nr:MAG: DNA polymerase III subunit beta [candidate division KSB1 bacterium RBG_16_48_16]
MDFTITKNDFYEALHKVIGVIPQKTTISILSCLSMSLEDELLSLTGTDLEISVTATVPVKSSTSGAVAVPARLLSEIVRELPDVPLHIRSDNSTKIIISTDKGEYKISTQPIEDFPKISVEEGQFSFVLDGKLFKRIIDKTSFAVSTDELRPALTGINMEINATDLRFVATDGHRLVRMVYNNFSAPEENQKNLIIPTKALMLLLRNLSDEDKVSIKTGEDHIVFNLNSATVYSKLINGSYPNYERVIPSGNDKKLHINREQLVAALRRVSIFSSSLTHQIRLIMSPNEISIQSEDIEFGAEAKESIPASFNADWLQIGYNSSYLLDVIRHLDNEEIVFVLKDSVSAAIISPSVQQKDEELLMLLMPIRINEDTVEGEDLSSEEVNQSPESEEVEVE